MATNSSSILFTGGVNHGDDPFIDAFGNPDIFRHISEFALTENYSLAVNERSDSSFGPVEFCRITRTSRFRWLPITGGRFSVDLEENLTTEDPIRTADFGHRHFRLAIDKKTGTVALRSFWDDRDTEIITFYEPGQHPRDVTVELPEAHIVMDLCVVNMSVFLATTLGFGWVNFSEGDPSYVPITDQRGGYYMLAKMPGFVFAFQGIIGDPNNTIDCFQLTDAGLPAQQQRWTVPPPDHVFVASYKYPVMVDQGNLLYMAMMFPQYGQGANLRGGNVESWNLTRISVSAFEDTVTALARLSLDTEPTGIVIRESTEEILVAVGRQGLLLLPMMFESDTQPTVLFDPAENQTVLGVQLHNDVPYVLVKEEDDDGLSTFAIVKVDTAGNNLPMSHPVPLGTEGYERLL